MDKYSCLSDDSYKAFLAMMGVFTSFIFSISLLLRCHFSVLIMYTHIAVLLLVELRHAKHTLLAIRP